MHSCFTPRKGLKLAKKDGEWQTVYSAKDNCKRLVVPEIGAFEADAVCLKINSVWGDSKAHVFAFELS